MKHPYSINFWQDKCRVQGEICFVHRPKKTNFFVSVAVTSELYVTLYSNCFHKYAISHYFALFHMLLFSKSRAGTCLALIGER